MAVADAERRRGAARYRVDIASARVTPGGISGRPASSLTVSGRTSVGARC